MKSKRRILGIDFFVGRLETVVFRAMHGGLLVVPSGPNLAKDFVQSAEYREAILTADIAITDSGFMVLLWRIRQGEWLPKHSGLAFFRAVMKRKGIWDKKHFFWIMPSFEELKRTQKWLNKKGWKIEEADFYVAPIYAEGYIEDSLLLSQIECRKPDIVVVGLGGGVQERLGLTLKKQLSYSPGIFCIGAAIAFLTGGQVNIPVWVDHLFLGWLFRIMYAPRRFGERYWHAFKLAPLIWKYCDRLPPMEKSERRAI